MQITEQLSRQTYSEHCQTFKIERFAKRIIPGCRFAAINLSRQGGRGVVELGYFNTSINISSKTQEKEVFGVFLQDTLKTTFWMENLTEGGHKAFLSKIRTLFSILKKSRETFPLPSSCAPVSVIVYASISLNMPKYP